MSAETTRILTNALAAAQKTFQSLGQLAEPLAQAAELVVRALGSGQQLLVCGNGGSAADAADFCTEFACRFKDDRRPYPALNLSQGGSLLTATGNDYGFEEIFARQVAAFGRPGDVLIAISTSGNSANIQRALEEAKARKLKTVALLGREGGTSRKIAEIDLIVPGTETARIQEAHKFLLHVLCEIAEARLPRS